MSIEFNHTIVWAHDSKESANFLCQILGLPAPAQWGPFQVVKTSNGVSVDYTDRSDAISAQHYAYLVSEPEFDEVLGRVKQRGLEFWADPARTISAEARPPNSSPSASTTIDLPLPVSPVSRFSPR